jgi:hypothetical protein
MENLNLPRSGWRMDGKSKISHNSPQSAGCVLTTATRAREARSILTHAAKPQNKQKGQKYDSRFILLPRKYLQKHHG